MKQLRDSSMNNQLQAIEMAKSSGPEAPRWLPRAAKIIFSELTDDLIAAGMPLVKADSHSISMAAHCLAKVSEAARAEAKARRLEKKQTNQKLAARYRKEAASAARAMARFERDAQVWLVAIGGTPAARLKLGIKPVKKKLGAVADLMAARKRMAIAK
jgi:phage terminase small subunit